MSKLSWTLLLVASMAGIAAFYPIAKILNGAVDPYVLAFFRYFVATLALISVMAYKNRLRLPPRNEWPFFLMLSFFFVMPTGLIVIGIAHTNSVVSAILVNTNALLIAFLAPMLILEHTNARKALAFVVGFTGVVAVVLNGQPLPVLLNSDYFFGAVLLLGASLLSALYGIYAKAYVRKYDGLYVTFFSSAIGSVMLAFVLVLGGKFSEMTVPAPYIIVSLLAIGIICTAIPHVVWSSSLKHLDAQTAGSFKLLIPIFAMAYSFLFFQESFTIWMLLGLLLTSAGIYIVQREEKVAPSVSNI